MSIDSRLKTVVSDHKMQIISIFWLITVVIAWEEHILSRVLYCYRFSYLIVLDTVNIRKFKSTYKTDEWLAMCKCINK